MEDQKRLLDALKSISEQIGYNAQVLEPSNDKQVLEDLVESIQRLPKSFEKAVEGSQDLNKKQKQYLSEKLVNLDSIKLETIVNKAAKAQNRPIQTLDDIYVPTFDSEFYDELVNIISEMPGIEKNDESVMFLKYWGLYLEFNAMERRRRDIENFIANGLIKAEIEHDAFIANKNITELTVNYYLDQDNSTSLDNLKRQVFAKYVVPYLSNNPDTIGDSSTADAIALVFGVADGDLLVQEYLDGATLQTKNVSDFVASKLQPEMIAFLHTIQNRQRIVENGEEMLGTFGSTPEENLFSLISTSLVQAFNKGVGGSEPAFFIKTENNRCFIPSSIGISDPNAMQIEEQEKAKPQKVKGGKSGIFQDKKKRKREIDPDTNVDGFDRPDSKRRSFLPRSVPVNAEASSSSDPIELGVSEEQLSLMVRESIERFGAILDRVAKIFNFQHPKGDSFVKALYHLDGAAQSLVQILDQLAEIEEENASIGFRMFTQSISFSAARTMFTNVIRKSGTAFSSVARTAFGSSYRFVRDKIYQVQRFSADNPMSGPLLSVLMNALVQCTLGDNGAIGLTAMFLVKDLVNLYQYNRTNQRIATSANLLFNSVQLANQTAVLGDAGKLTAALSTIRAESLPGLITTIGRLIFAIKYSIAGVGLISRIPRLAWNNPMKASTVVAACGVIYLASDNSMPIVGSALTALTNSLLPSSSNSANATEPAETCPLPNIFSNTCPAVPDPMCPLEIPPPPAPTRNTPIEIDLPFKRFILSRFKTTKDVIVEKVEKAAPERVQRVFETAKSVTRNAQSSSERVQQAIESGDSTVILQLVSNFAKSVVSYISTVAKPTIEKFDGFIGTLLTQISENRDSTIDFVNIISQPLWQRMVVEQIQRLFLFRTNLPNQRQVVIGTGLFLSVLFASSIIDDYASVGEVATNTVVQTIQNFSFDFGNWQNFLTNAFSEIDFNLPGVFQTGFTAASNVLALLGISKRTVVTGALSAAFLFYSELLKPVVPDADFPIPPAPEILDADENPRNPVDLEPDQRLIDEINRLWSGQPPSRKKETAQEKNAVLTRIGSLTLDIGRVRERVFTRSRRNASETALRNRRARRLAFLQFGRGQKSGTDDITVTPELIQAPSSSFKKPSCPSPLDEYIRMLQMQNMQEKQKALWSEENPEIAQVPIVTLDDLVSNIKLQFLLRRMMQGYQGPPSMAPYRQVIVDKYQDIKDDMSDAEQERHEILFDTYLAANSIENELSQLIDRDEVFNKNELTLQEREEANSRVSGIRGKYVLRGVERDQVLVENRFTGEVSGIEGVEELLDIYNSAIDSYDGVRAMETTSTLSASKGKETVDDPFGVFSKLS